ncbi:OmpH family outer membrane protein [Neiella marina]|uniref:OmpH family outer membrane protein n=1 Tax=Neiella holothuriorum TaxID=2870530 RepID=A0ABS7EGF9_9GAMM|nr:OmpH family outer membrane protein [Neiella holothuriorum]MBW8190886.1 OmpH family outer membrane protein [Neiella holothuriorum]
MKKLVAVATVGLALFAGVVQASGIAVVDLGRIVKNIPQSEATADLLQKEFSDRVVEIQNVEKQMASKQEEARRNEALLTDEQKIKVNRELQELEASLKLKAKALQQDGQRRQAEENKKIFILIQRAISEIAEKEGYDAVVDRQTILYAKPNSDISAKVVEHLSKK